MVDLEAAVALLKPGTFGTTRLPELPIELRRDGRLTSIVSLAAAAAATDGVLQRYRWYYVTLRFAGTRYEDPRCVSCTSYPFF